MDSKGKCLHDSTHDSALGETTLIPSLLWGEGWEEICRAASLPPGKISYKAVVSLPENNCKWEGSRRASLMEEIEKFYNTTDAPSTALLPFSFFGHTAGMAIWTCPLTCALLMPRADITNQFLYSFLGSPDRTSERLSGLHPGTPSQWDASSIQNGTYFQSCVVGRCPKSPKYVWHIWLF